MSNNIILIGFMGAGKTTIGKKIAKIRQWEFVDTDLYIEEKAGIRISDIFAQKGEEYFRQLETDTLIDLLKNTTNTIISVGGGLPLREENRKLLHQLGKILYLKATADTIYDRVKGDTTRPLLRSDNPKERIKILMAERESIYMDTADNVIITDEKNISSIAGEINVLIP